MSNMARAAEVLDPMARAVFAKALADNRCGELLAHLFDGGGVTIDYTTGALILVTKDDLEAALGR